MAKTEIILTNNVPGLGGESDQLKVAAGYARNYLFPRGLAIPLTAANKRRIEVLRQRRSERESHEVATMTELAQTLSKLTLRIPVKTGDDGRLFGSVTAVNVAEELKQQYDASVDKKKVHLDHPIKNIGEHDVELRLHPQVTTTLKIRVESTNPAVKRPAPETPAKAAPAAAAESKPAKRKAPVRKKAAE